MFLFFYFPIFLDLKNDDKSGECSCVPVATLTRSINSGIINNFWLKVSLCLPVHLCGTNMVRWRSCQGLSDKKTLDSPPTHLQQTFFWLLMRLDMSDEPRMDWYDLSMSREGRTAGWLQGGHQIGLQGRHQGVLKGTPLPLKYNRRQPCTSAPLVIGCWNECSDLIGLEKVRTH